MFVDFKFSKWKIQVSGNLNPMENLNIQLSVTGIWFNPLPQLHRTCKQWLVLVYNRLTVLCCSFCQCLVESTLPRGQFAFEAAWDRTVIEFEFSKKVVKFEYLLFCPIFLYFDISPTSSDSTYRVWGVKGVILILMSWKLFFFLFWADATVSSDYLNPQEDLKFGTWDRDPANCAQKRGGGWWLA